MDRPGIRSVHTNPTPRIGGIAIFLSSTCLIVSLFFLNNTIGERFREVRFQVITLLCTATCVFLIGLVDDLRRLPARFKFMAELLGAGVLCLVGVRISSIGMGEGAGISLGWLGWPITLLWIVGVTNAVNMSDGLDGLAAGIAAIACGVIAVLTLHGSTVHVGAAQSNDIMMALFALALLGSLSGFLFFNFNPAKIFMGDCGSLFIGFTIASASVMCVSKSAALVGLALPALALGIPIFDTLFSMLRRFLERRSLFAADRSHFHHRLLELGLTQRRAVMLIYMATALAAGLGLLMLVSDRASSLAVLGGVLLTILFLFQFVGGVRLQQILVRLREKYRDVHQKQDEQKMFEALQLRFRQARSFEQWWQAVCEAARQMDFAWVSLKTTRDGRTDEQSWRSPHNTPGRDNMIIMSIPAGKTQAGTRTLELAIERDGSFEAAGHRAVLFSRLLDEYSLVELPRVTENVR